MKIVELTTSIKLPVTNEEYTLYRSFTDESVTAKRDLNPREQHIANQLVNKDLLVRLNENGKIIYKKKRR